MVEQIYEVIKSELKNASSDVTIRLDQLRRTLEPYIYHYLIQQHMPTLNKFWASYLPPKTSKYALVIVERRHHPNFEFILKNIAWAAPFMSVYIFCSDINREFISSLLGDKESSFNIVQVFSGNPSREEGKLDYDKLHVDPNFYRQIRTEYMLTVQVDCIFRRKLTPEFFQGDYWGNPWAWKQDYPGGGGATVRRIAKMIEICETCIPDLSIGYLFKEDSWLADRIREYGKFPPLEVRRQCIMESIPVNNPYILHQFWTFVEQYQSMTREQLIGYLRHLLSLEMS